MNDYLVESVGNGLVIVRNVKGAFFRAQIIETPYDHKPFKVRLIDYGNNVKCEVGDFYTCIGRTCEERKSLLKEIFRYPPLCFEAKLAECKPDVIYQTGWSQNATDKFQAIINAEDAAGRQIKILVYSFNNYDKVAAVNLVLRKTPEESVAKILTDLEFAKIANESYIYQISRVTDEIKTKSKNEHFDFKDYTDAPRGYDRLALTGPISTFAHNTFERTTYCHANDVSIDPWSVNSILIDPYPFDGVRKVMVAACRSKNDKGKTTLRHTSVLPHVNGMACLLALIFCPTAELRYDKNFNRFTSILSGMGCTFDGRALYKEHDCLFFTDVDIDDQDIVYINQLRETMSELMENFHTTDENYRENKRIAATELVFKIMRRGRAQLGVTMNDSFKWNGENALKKNFEENMRMFPAHNPRPLQPYSMERWRTLKMLNNELEEKARTNARDESIRCVLCEEQIETLNELKVHVIKSKHVYLVCLLNNSKPSESIKRERHTTIDDDTGYVYEGAGPSGYFKKYKTEK